MPAALAILAHPDDAEFLCAGTFLRLHREHGWRIHLATMTPGDCGSAEHTPTDIAAIRRAEGSAAAVAIGATYDCLEERDLRVIYGNDVMEKTVRLINRLRPELVITHSPADYMLDHEVTSTIVRAAAFAAPIPNFMPERRLGSLLPGIPHLYYCDPIEGKDPLGNDVTPGFRIDITSVIDAKADMLAAHASQRDWLMKHHGMDHYVQSVRDWSAKRGSEGGVAFAEGFRQHLGHSYPQDNVIGQMLGTC